MKSSVIIIVALFASVTFAMPFMKFPLKMAHPSAHRDGDPTWVNSRIFKGSSCENPKEIVRIISYQWGNSEGCKQMIKPCSSIPGDLSEVVTCDESPMDLPSSSGVIGFAYSNNKACSGDLAVSAWAATNVCVDRDFITCNSRTFTDQQYSETFCSGNMTKSTADVGCTPQPSLNLSINLKCQDS